VERDLDDEMQGFVDELVERRVRQGVPLDEARRQVLAETGSVSAVKENIRDVLPAMRLDTWVGDIRSAFRAIRRQPIVAAVIVVTLAIGIGANTAVFTLIDAVGWRPLPIANPQNLLLVGRAQGTVVETGFTYPQFLSMRRAGIAELEGYSSAIFPVPLSSDDTAQETLDGELVSGGYFALLGIAPGAGRLIGPDDDRTPGNHAVAVISHGLWQSRFGGLLSALGRTLTLNGVTFTIVGMTPRGFSGIDVGRSPDVYVPMAMQREVMPVVGDLIVQPNVNRTWVEVIARSHDGAPASQLAASLQRPFVDGTPPVPGSIAAGPETRLTVEAIPRGVSEVRTQFATGLRILWGLVTTVLLLACANIANLLLARADARRTEFALRLSLGAGRWRLGRRLAIGHLVLGAFPRTVAGMVMHEAGVLLAAGLVVGAGLTAISATLASRMLSAVLFSVSPLDPASFAGSALVLLAAAAVAASVPALRAARVVPMTALRMEQE